MSPVGVHELYVHGLVEGALKEVAGEVHLRGTDMDTRTGKDMRRGMYRRRGMYKRRG